MILEKTLENFGLNQKQAQIYLACLELGPATATAIAKKAQIKRPTAYVILEELKERGLISVIPKERSTIYLAEKPLQLLENFEEKAKKLREIMPFLQALDNQNKIKPQVRFYEGQEGVLKVYQEIYRSKVIDFFGSMKEIYPYFSATMKHFLTISKQKKIKVRDLLTSSDEDLAYGRAATRSKLYEVRFLPPKYLVNIDCALYQNKLAILAVKKEFFAIIIESEEVFNSFKSLFELAWQQARPL